MAGKGSDSSWDRALRSVELVLFSQRVTGSPVVVLGNRPTASARGASRAVTVTFGTVTVSAEGGSVSEGRGAVVTATVLAWSNQSIAERGCCARAAPVAANPRKTAALIRLKNDVLPNLGLVRREVRTKKRPDIGIGHQGDKP